MTPDEEGRDPDQTVPLDAAATGDETRVSFPRGMDARQFARTFLGRRLGEYEILEEIGHGSMGIVFAARHDALDRTVALKVLPPSLSVTPTVIRRFLREAQSVAQLDHESIVRIYGIGDQDGVFFYAMQYVEGAPLDQVIRERDLTPKDCAKITAQAARALFFAHEHGIIHRDVKPANIILTYKDRPVLTDFGLARPEKAATLTESGALVGTPIYMSPEQVRGDRHKVDRRTDIYSLGVTFYEMLTGRTPYEADSTQEILHKSQFQEPKAVRRRKLEVPKDLETICHKAIEKHPDRRYQTAIELALDLERFLNGEPIQAKRTGVGTRLVRQAKRHKAITALGAVALIALVAFVVTGRQGRKRVEHLQLQQYTGHMSDGIRLVERKKDWAGALERFEAAIAIDPEQPTPYVERGRCYYLLDNYEDAFADFEIALSLDPNDPRARMWRGLVHWRSGRFDEGAADVESVLHSALDDRECLIEATDLCLEYHRLSADNLVTKDKFLTAGYKWMQMLLDLDPNDDEALVLRGLYYDTQGMRDLAIQSWRRATEVNQNNVRAWALLTDATAVRPEIDATAAEVTAADPDVDPIEALAPWWGVLTARGVGYATRGLDITGDKVLDQALDVLNVWDHEPTPSSPGSDDPTAALEPTSTVDLEALLIQAETQWSGGARPLAVPIYERILRHDPQIVGPHLRLAEYYLALRDLDRAKASVERARQLAEANPRTLLMAAQVYAARGERENFEEVVSAARKYHPGILESEVLERSLDFFGFHFEPGAGGDDAGAADSTEPLGDGTPW